jgi:hypothetical protein
LYADGLIVGNIKTICETVTVNRPVGATETSPGADWNRIDRVGFSSLGFPFGNHVREGCSFDFVEDVKPTLPRGHDVAEPIAWTSSRPYFYVPANIVYVPPARDFVFAERSVPFGFQ